MFRFTPCVYKDVQVIPPCVNFNSAGCGIFTAGLVVSLFFLLAIPVSFDTLLLYLPNKLAKKLLNPCFFFANAMLSDFTEEFGFCETVDGGVLVLFEAGFVLWAKVSPVLAMKKNSKAITIKGNLLCDTFLLNVWSCLPVQNQNQACRFRGINFYNDRKVISNKEKNYRIDRLRMQFIVIKNPTKCGVLVDK